MEDDSGYGSGCQSGWSLYLGPSSGHTKSNDNEEEEGEGEKVDGEEDEGISTVSDASSGPHKFHEAAQKDSGKRRRTEMNNPARGKVSASSLEDTASSPFLNFSDTVCREISTSLVLIL